MGGLIRVQRVLIPDSKEESWTLQYSATTRLRSSRSSSSWSTWPRSSDRRTPSSLRPRSEGLVQLPRRPRLEWRTVTLRLPPEARGGKVAVLPTAGHYCSAASSSAASRNRFSISCCVTAISWGCPCSSKKGGRLEGCGVPADYPISGVPGICSPGVTEGWTHAGRRATCTAIYQRYPSHRPRKSVNTQTNDSPSCG